MIPLIVLITVFAVIFIADKFILKNRLGLSYCGRIALAFMLIVTGIAHFTNTPVMIEMMPEMVPFKTEVVYITGILELVAAGFLISKNYSIITSYALIIFFIAIIPANIVGSMKRLALGGMENGISYLYFRIPLQIFFIAWTYYFGIKRNTS